MFLASFCHIKFLKSFLPGETLLDTTTVLLSKFSIEKGSYVGDICIFKFQCH